MIESISDLYFFLNLGNNSSIQRDMNLQPVSSLPREYINFIFQITIQATPRFISLTLIMEVIVFVVR